LGEAALIDQFRCGLRDDVQNLLLTLTDPSSFNDAITQALWCDNRLFKHHQEKKVTSNARLWKQLAYYTSLSSPNNTSCPTCLFWTCFNTDRRSQV
jgi:hypothetical protein